MNIIKYLAIAVGVVLLLVVGLAVYLAATFDPNDYKPQIVQLVKDKKQRTLKLEGDIKLSFWPNIGADLGALSLSEFKSEKEFAAISGARVSLKLMPLLSRQLIVDEIRIRGLRANIVRFKDGSTNIDDLLASDDKDAQQFAFDIDHVAIEDAALTYSDQASGARYAVSRLNLKTGRIAPDVQTRVEFAAAITGNQPKLDATLDLKTQLTFNLDKKLYSLRGLAAELKGQVGDLSGLNAKASGDVTARLDAGEFTARALTMTANGMRGKEKMDVKLDMPGLTLTRDKASGEKFSIEARFTGPDGATVITASLPGLEGTAKAFRAAAMTLDVERKQGALSVKAKISSPLSGSVESRQISLPQLKASITAAGPDLPGKSIAGEFAGSASVDGAKERIQADIAGKIADSNVKARLSVAGFAPPALGFDVEIDQLDLDRYFPPGSATAGKKPEQPFDLSALKTLRASGSVRIGRLKASNISASNVRLDIKAADGRVVLSPLAAGLYDGNLSGSVTINAAPAAPTFAVRQNLAGVNIGPLLRDLMQNDKLEGRGTVALDVTTQGNTVSALKKALNGSAGVRLVDGAVKGIDIAGTIRNARSTLGSLRGEQVQKSDTRQRTDFSELSGTFQIRDGVAHNKDLSMKSPLLRVGGAGAVDIGADTLDYTVKASIVGTSQGQGGRDVQDLRGLTVPVRVTGPLAAPSYKLDFGAMVTDTAKKQVEQIVTDRLQERLGGGAAKGATNTPGGGALQDKLRGLFGR